MYVIRDVEQYGLSRQLCLAESDQCDAVLCALVVDLDFDGENELLLGTYGQVQCCITFKQKFFHNEIHTLGYQYVQICV